MVPEGSTLDPSRGSSDPEEGTEAEWGPEPPAGAERPRLLEVLESAAKLQLAVPDAVLVGGTAAALRANHRDSTDHDHVLGDLSERFDAVLEAVESTDGWVTNRVTPKKIILEELGGIEAGVRQLIRTRPLEVFELRLPSGGKLRAPTLDETLRVKGYLLVLRNQTRDYLDVAALADRSGVAHAAEVFGHIDDYYADQRPRGVAGVATQLARQLADPQPADRSSVGQLSRYKGLEPRWTDWDAVVEVCRAVATGMVTQA